MRQLLGTAALYASTNLALPTRGEPKLYIVNTGLGQDIHLVVGVDWVMIIVAGAVECVFGYVYLDIHV